MAWPWNGDQVEVFLILSTESSRNRRRSPHPFRRATLQRLAPEIQEDDLEAGARGARSGAGTGRKPGAGLPLPTPAPTELNGTKVTVGAAPVSARISAAAPGVFFDQIGGSVLTGTDSSEEGGYRHAIREAAAGDTPRTREFLDRLLKEVILQPKMNPRSHALAGFWGHYAGRVTPPLERRPDHKDAMSILTTCPR